MQSLPVQVLMAMLSSRPNRTQITTSGCLSKGSGRRASWPLPRRYPRPAKHPSGTSEDLPPCCFDGPIHAAKAAACITKAFP